MELVVFVDAGPVLAVAEGELPSLRQGLEQGGVGWTHGACHAEILARINMMLARLANLLARINMMLA